MVNHQFSGQEFTVNVGFAADTVLIDPQLKIITKFNTVVKEEANGAVNQLKLYPNPAPDKLFISIMNPTDKKLSIRLFNTIGQLVYRKDYELSGNDEMLNIPMQRFAKGVYYLKLKGDKSIDIVQKIMR